MSGLDEWHGQSPAPDRELEDRTAGTIGEGEIEIQVAGVVRQVEVVQPGERRGRLRIASPEAGPVDDVNPPNGSDVRPGVAPRAR